MTAKTAIRVDEDILRILKQLKGEKDQKSYSDVLREVLKESEILSRSERNSLPKLKPFDREKHDRF